MKFSNNKNKVKVFYFDLLKCNNAYLILILNFNLVTTSIFGQSKIDSNIIDIKCELPKIVRANKDLKIKIIIRNKSGQTQYFYDKLVEGVFTGDLVLGQLKSFVDISFQVEKKTGSRFKSYKGSFIDPAPGSDSTDVPSKSEVYSGDSVIKYFQVDSRYSFIPDDYRLRCLYYNDIHLNHYVESKWIYFHVLNTIYARHDYDQ